MRRVARIFFDKCVDAWKDIYLETYKRLFFVSSSKPKKRLAQTTSNHKADKRAKRQKKVEDEVEKIVEKIVEKPVIQEKIIEKEIEVPKQIEKKVFVHVPFPTDDPEVIKKGPMIYNDKDKKK